jgi:hypothetical protein
MGIFQIEGAEYWDDPMKNASRVLREFVPKGRFGMFIDAPHSVSLTDAVRIPLLFLYAAKRRESAVLDPWKMALLVCVRLEDRSLEVDRLLDEPELESVFDESQPSETDPGDDAMAITDETDLLRIRLMRRRGTYLLTAIMLDRASNRVTIKLSAPYRGYQDDAVPAFLEKLRRPIPAPERIQYAPGQTAESFQPNLYSPALPDGPGLVLDCERVVLYEKGARAWLRGAVRIPVLAREIVPPPVEIGPDPYGEPRPVTIVSVWLVITGSRDATAETVLLRIPIFAPGPVLPGDLVTGYFEYDLFADPSIAGIPQTNFIYAFAGDMMAGPARCAIVTEEMVREFSRE